MGREHRNPGGSSFGSTDPFGGGPFAGEDADPLATVANLTDVMLVFAVALIIALINVMDVDFTAIQKIVKDEQMEEVEDLETSEDDITSEGSTFNERGTVYEDPETGDLYLVQE